MRSRNWEGAGLEALTKGSLFVHVQSGSDERGVVLKQFCYLRSWVQQVTRLRRDCDSDARDYPPSPCDIRMRWSNRQLRWVISRDSYRLMAEPLARDIAVTRITSVRWRGHISPKNTEIGPHRRITTVQSGIAEWLARVDRVPWTLAIDNWKSRKRNDMLYP